MTVKRWIVSLVCITTALLAGLGTAGAASPNGDQVLQQVQAAVTTSGDRVSVQTMRLVDANGSERVRKLQLYELGKDRMLTVFLEPADVRGIRLLVLPDDRTYLYMPAFGRVRRIASHVKNQKFLGTDLTYEDFSLNYADKYDVEVFDDHSDEAAFYLELKPKPNSGMSYARVKMWVDEDKMPVKMEFFSGDNELLKRMTLEPDRINGRLEIGRLEVESLETGHRTVIELEDVRRDTGLDAAFFDVRNLRRAGG